ncbi:DUF167 domain-containing protein [Candidatus Woesearchaeota archaeon]|nr:DUF167 domain-containing protein [Candidatus Woesearchaeota archaeon]
MIDVFDVPVSKSIKIRVKTNAPSNKILAYDEATKVFKVAIHARAQNNEANREVVKFFTKMFHKPVRIKTGFTSKEKLLVFD